MSATQIKRVYLLAYNTTCAFLWLRILLSLPILLLTTPNALPHLYTTLEPWARWTQSLAVAEILHAALGITRAPVFTTFTQVFARSVQVWAINYGFPAVTASSPAYSWMLFAWSSADVVRFLYFVVLLATGSVPGVLTWLRYSLFTVLYPIGIGGEWWLMYRAATVAESNGVAGILYFCLGLYGPGSVMMYGYMLKQRHKTLSKVGHN